MVYSEEERRKQRAYYCKVLGVPLDARRDQVRERFRQLAQEYHPDKLRDLPAEARKNAEDYFKVIKEAYEFLSAPQNFYRGEARGPEATGVSFVRDVEEKKKGSSPVPPLWGYIVVFGLIFLCCAGLSVVPNIGKQEPAKATEQAVRQTEEAGRRAVQAIKILSLSPVLYETFGGKTERYWKMKIQNSDSVAHKLQIVFRWSEDRPQELEESFYIEPGTRELTVSGGFAERSYDPRELEYTIFTVDGFPVRDPQEVISKIEVWVNGFRVSSDDRSDETRYDCSVTIRNSDAFAHYISLGGKIQYGYIERGELVTKSTYISCPGYYSSCGEIGANSSRTVKAGTIFKFVKERLKFVRVTEVYIGVKDKTVGWKGIVRDVDHEGKCDFSY